MPTIRLIGNAGLTFFVKFSTGYWSVVDPTNGFIAIRADAVAQSALERLANRYFFEIDLLCWFGLRRRIIAEVEMPAIYAGAHSSLSIGRILLDFPGRLLIRFLQRLLINYVVVEINVGTLYATIGIPALLAGLIYGSIHWYQSAITHVPAATGVIVLALLLFTVGFQLTLQALLYDVQFATPTKKLRRDSHELRIISRNDFLP
jgi:dolichol-phosphate mannosyltransferase